MLRYETDKRLHIQEHNRQAIVTSWNALSRRLDSRGTGSARVPIALADGSCVLGYGTQCSDVPLYSEDGSLLIRSVNTRIIVGDSLAASRDYWFYDSHKGYVVVVSNSTTEDGYSSRGLGSGLLFLSDVVIQDGIRRFEDLRNMPVIARIRDGARDVTLRTGETIKRKGWTSEFASRLGYEFDVEEDAWTRTYT